MGGRGRRGVLGSDGTSTFSSTGERLRKGGGGGGGKCKKNALIILPSKVIGVRVKFGFGHLFSSVK